MLKLGCGQSSACGTTIQPEGRRTASDGDNPSSAKMNLSVPSGAPQSLASSSRGSATGNPRNKTALKPGRSLMDWIRLGKSGEDLTGNGGKRLQVTAEELAKHNKQNDAWMAIRGYVYNVTAYMEYHPGGIEELMKGVGQDATTLFDEVHRWVNFQSMLAACLVGKLVDGKRPSGTSPLHKLVVSPPSSSSSLIANKSAQSSLPMLAPPVGRPKPRYDMLQAGDSVTVVIYTKWHKMCHENVIIDRKSSKELKITVLVEDYTYIMNIELEQDLLYDYEVRVSKPSGKTEVVFKKVTLNIQWTSLGTPLEGHGTWEKTTDLAVSYRACTLESISPVTHDTNLYCVKLPDGTRMCVPLGHHVHLKADVQGTELSRSYTVVPPDIGTDADLQETEQGSHIHLLIKIYSDGALTSQINQYKIGNSIHISNHEGTFRTDQLVGCESVVLCAAGTGFTPMAGLLQYVLCNQPDHERLVYLLFFNKDLKDILWHDKLHELTNRHNNFRCQHVLSQPDTEWTGLRGRINREILESFIPVSSESHQLFCACGPTPFTKEAVRLAEELGYSSRQIHAFVG